MFKILFYAILFLFAYRILKKLFLPAYGDSTNQRNNQKQDFSRNTSNFDKSNEIEDVDYEEVE